MTISSTYAPDTYAGDASTTTFAITFAFLSVSTNVKVSIKVDATSVITEKTAATHYNVSGSNVVFTAGNIPAVGETIIIELDPDFTQDSDYAENGRLPAETVETDFDERVIEAQYNKDQAGRAVKVDSTVDLTSFSAVLPDAVNNGILGFNGDSTGLAVVEISDASLLTITGTTANGVQTYNAANSLTTEANLTFDGSTLTVTGAIAVSSTVDGRDIATDGTKLDGIEALADVTDETNVKSSLDGATITSATVATGDKVLVQDVDDSDNLKTVTAQSIADLVLAASQAEQEAGTEAAKYVAPLTQQYHPSAAKGWAKFNAAASISVSYNVTSITDDGTGEATVNWATDFSTANYTALGSPDTTNTSSFRFQSSAAGSIQIDHFTVTTPTLVDPDYYYVVAFGDQ